MQDPVALWKTHNQEELTGGQSDSLPRLDCYHLSFETDDKVNSCYHLLQFNDHNAIGIFEIQYGDGFTL